VVKDDEMRIHLGANSRPISFEYYTENLETSQTTSATYYYHYDLHGNVIRVTNSSGTTVITYTYDPLGNILTESNSNSICNPFTYMGEAQVIHDSEFDTSSSSPKTGLYNAGSGYYNPETGTALGGTGAPASTNPTSATAEEPTAQSTRSASQLGGHAAISAIAGSVPSSSTPASSSDATPESAYDGVTEPTIESPPVINPTESTNSGFLDPNGPNVVGSDSMDGG
jgi:YD repeat-containing protein